MNFLKDNCWWKVGNGGSINIWSDRWVQGFPSLDVYRLPSLLYVRQLMSDFCSNWNVDLVNYIPPRDFQCHF